MEVRTIGNEFVVLCEQSFESLIVSISGGHDRFVERRKIVSGAELFNLGEGVFVMSVSGSEVSGCEWHGVKWVVVLSACPRR